MMKLPPITIDPIVLGGGLDLITPTLSLKNNFARSAINFECGVSGGYTRIAGYERFDGRTSPSLSTLDQRYISVSSITTAPVVGASVTTSGGATGKIAAIYSTYTLLITATTGTFTVGDTLSTTGVVGTIDNVYAGPASTLQDAMSKNAVADIYRALITAVPGSGPVRGVVMYNDVVYAFRNNAGGTALDVYKSTTSGWTQVVLFNTVSFTAGGATAPADGATLTQGGVTAVIKRVVRTGGSWTANTAVGQFVIAAPAGGNFAAGAATIGAINVTLSGAQAAITLAAGGKFEFEETNFGGQAQTRRLYGVDGVNAAFEFDGTVLVPITSISAPTHIACHRNYLFLSSGSSVFHSGPGLPYDFTATSGGSEIATGDTVTGMVVMPGSNADSTLGVFSRNNTSILYGTSTSNWNLVQYNTGTGALPYSIRNMAQTLVFDDRGAISIQAALQYGNFAQATLTTLVLPFINSRVNLLTYSTLNRSKSQYRVFFSDGYGLYITVVNSTLLGCMPVYFPNPVYCAFEGKTTTGTDVNFFGSTDGFVYQMDKGTSFDGADIPWTLQLNYSNAKSPRVLKKYRRASVELTTDTDSYVQFDFGYYLGYASGEIPQPDIATYSQSVSTAAWDSFIWDTFFWDVNSVAPLNCDIGGSAENMAMVISGSSDYVAPFTINSILVHFNSRRMMR